MRRRRRLNRRVAPPSHERWLVSYADFITLMFAFFTVLYASSTVDARKLASVVDSMQHVFAGEGAPPLSGPPVEQHIVPPPLEPPGADLVVVRDALRKDLSSEIQRRSCRRSNRMRADWSCRFKSPAASRPAARILPPAAQQLIARRRRSVCANIPNALRVEGHTDDVPIQTSKYCVELGPVDRAGDARGRLPDYTPEHIEPARLSAAGYSEFHPRVPNDSAGEPRQEPAHRHRDPEHATTEGRGAGRARRRARRPGPGSTARRPFSVRAAGPRAAAVSAEARDGRRRGRLRHGDGRRGSVGSELVRQLAGRRRRGRPG